MRKIRNALLFAMVVFPACAQELETVQSIQQEREKNLQAYVDFCKKRVSEKTGNMQSVLLAENMLLEFNRNQQDDLGTKIRYQEKIVDNLKKVYEVEKELNGANVGPPGKMFEAKESWLKEKQILLEMKE